MMYKHVFSTIAAVAAINGFALAQTLERRADMTLGGNPDRGKVYDRSPGRWIGRSGDPRG